MDVSITDKGRERLSLSMAKSTKLEMYGGWYVQIVVDGDNHLTVYLSNSDGTQVHDVGEDLSLRVHGETGVGRSLYYRRYRKGSQLS